MTTLTDRQREILAFIAEREYAGAPVSFRELEAKFRVTRNAVNDHLLLMAKKGALDWTPMKSRAIRVRPAGWKLLGYSTCDHCGGRVAPGKGRAA